MPKALLVIAPETFRDEEYAEPKEVLEESGFAVTTASVEPGMCTGRFGLEARAEIALRDVAPSDYGIVAFVGGGGSRVFFDDPHAHRVAREALGEGRVLGAICIAPVTLAHAGLLEGLTVTSFPSEQAEIEAHGATWTGRPVEVDGRIVTANGPEAATAFGHELVRVWRES